MNAFRIPATIALPALLIPQAGATPAWWIRYRDTRHVHARSSPRHSYGVAVRTGAVYRELRHKNCVPVPACRVPDNPRDFSGSNRPGCVA
ncbi:MAG: hypothetical protein WC593_04895 [Methanoregula sp.]